MTYPVAEVGIVPLHPIVDLFGIGIEQKLVPVKAQTSGGIIVAVHAISIEQTWAGLRQITMPDLIRLLSQRDTVSLPPPR